MGRDERSTIAVPFAGMENEITELLERWATGDANAFKALVPVVYEELRRLAGHYLEHERGNHTLQPTALVHEAYLRLAGLRDLRLNNRAHFYGAAAQVMRRVLVDHARQRKALKRGGPDNQVVSLDEAIDAPVDLRLDVMALDEALAALERSAPEQARVVELRYFGGLTVEETAEYLSVAPATVHRRWAYARAWLFRRLTAPPGGEGSADPESEGGDERRPR
jgi:RNA polymerase sigma factor (TIGR02999 family)